MSGLNEWSPVESLNPFIYSCVCVLGGGGGGQASYGMKEDQKISKGPKTQRCKNDNEYTNSVTSLLY